MRRQAASVQGELQRGGRSRARRRLGRPRWPSSPSSRSSARASRPSLFLTGQAAVGSSDGGADCGPGRRGRRPRRSPALHRRRRSTSGSRRINLATLLPLDRRRPRLHRGRPAEPRGPRVHRDRAHQRRHADAVRPQRDPARTKGDGSVLGQMLRALFGYTSTPEVATFAVWLTYVVVVLALFLRPVKRPPAPAPRRARSTSRGLIVRTAGSPRDPAARRRGRTGRSSRRTG